MTHHTFYADNPTSGTKLGDCVEHDISPRIGCARATIWVCNSVVKAEQQAALCGWKSLVQVTTHLGKAKELVAATPLVTAAEIEASKTKVSQIWEAFQAAKAVTRAPNLIYICRKYESIFNFVIIVLGDPLNLLAE